MNHPIDPSIVPDRMLEQRLQLLCECRTPLLIGVRHHSAAMSRAINALLDRFQPKSVLIELPSDLNSWLEYLADTDTVAPVAISAVDQRGQLSFYPLADFSPELVAIRWAFAHGVPAIACDLTISAKSSTSDEDSFSGTAVASADPLEVVPPIESLLDADQASELLGALLRRTGATDTGQLWERLVESPAIVADAEVVRQMGLIFGWAIRTSAIEIPHRDLLREAAMRESIRKADGPIAAIVGSFHAAALLPDVISRCELSDRKLLESLKLAPDSVGVSLIPYSFEQLDERSGYPAGICDPVWHQRMVEAACTREMDAAAIELMVDMCRYLRSRGHVAGTPDVTEVIRMMRELAQLRCLPSAGRGELIESIQTCLVQGELHGRAREVARAAEHVLIGHRQGKVTAKTPRCGLALSLEKLLDSLGLPTALSADAEPREIRLDVLRSPRDRARAVVLRQLSAAGIPFAKRVDTVEQGDRENLAERWEVSWQKGTAATIESVSRFGVDLPQVVEGILQFSANFHPTGVEPASTSPQVFLKQLQTASECGLHGRVRLCMSTLDVSFLPTAGLEELVACATTIGRIAAGHVPGMPRDPLQAFPPIICVFYDARLDSRLAGLLRACLDRLDGLEGSDDVRDVAGVSDLVQWFNGELQTALATEFGARSVNTDSEISTLFAVGTQRLNTWCSRTVARGSARMRGAAAGVLCILQRKSADELAALMSGWYDAALDADSRRRFRDSLSGATQILLSLMQADPIWLSGIETRLQESSDERFLERLPALRGAFNLCSPADRNRLLEVRLDGYQERGSGLVDVNLLSDEALNDATELAAFRRAADLAGRQAVLNLIPDFRFSLVPEWQSSMISAPEMPKLNPRKGPLATELARPKLQLGIPMADRWRMIMGLPPETQFKASRAARSLDQLYGRGRGEGSRGGLANRRTLSGRGGTQSAQPTAVEWSDELEGLFGADVCQEVLGEAAGNGNLSAMEALDADSVTPSIQLLQQVLSLAGGMSEGRTERLRRLAKRITEQLAKKLAIRLRSSLSGLSTPRPTRRRSRRLNLQRTIRDNLVNVYRRKDGRPAIVAERLFFNSATRREMDWHLTFVVDVSGSMTASVVYSALCAAIFSELPALSVRFLAFSTSIIDLSGHITDPLTLLLEVQVGGGTHIGLGLRAARAKIKVPSRSIVVLVSDFEEGVSLGEMLSEIRALVSAGVKCVGLAALDDSGTARYHQGYAQLVAAAGMPVAAVSPERLANWVGDQIRGQAGQAAKLPVGTISS